jgi:hypothetical protein
MAELDAGVALLVGVGAAIVGSERVRRTIGRGAGFVAGNAMKLGSPVIHAGQDIVEDARDVAAPHARAGQARSSRSKAAA